MCVCLRCVFVFVRQCVSASVRVLYVRVCARVNAASASACAHPKTLSAYKSTAPYIKALKECLTC
jgi:hypothetical protein